MKRFFVKTCVIVTLMTTIGWYACRVQSEPAQPTQPPASTVTEDGATTTTAQSIALEHDAGKANDQFHCWLHLDEANHGGPGELSVRGVYEIGQPHPAGTIDDREYTIAVSVYDSQGHTIVDHDPIGVVVDRVGIGHWSDEFHWSKPFLPGKYYVEMMAVVPGTEVTRFNGTVGPALTAYSSIYAIVN